MSQSRPRLRVWLGAFGAWAGWALLRAFGRLAAPVAIAIGVLWFCAVAWLAHWVSARWCASVGGQLFDLLHGSWASPRLSFWEQDGPFLILFLDLALSMMLLLVGELAVEIARRSARSALERAQGDARARLEAFELELACGPRREGGPSAKARRL